MIVQAFLRWAETAGAQDRAKAADALARAYLSSAIAVAEKRSAEMAMTCLLDDPSPRVRAALAGVLCHSAEAPRHIVLSLAEDQPEIASLVILARRF